MSNLPAPRYSLWQAVSAALALGLRAIEEVRALAREPGPKGDQGDPGKPGLGFDDLDVTFDGERAVTLKFVRGELAKEFTFNIPAVIDRGVWKEGAFSKGDGVTWGGSFFIAQRDTTAKPETVEAKDDWRLAVKRGRDGRDGKPGEKGEKGLEGKPGRDGVLR